MSVLVVGGDRLGNITSKLKVLGFTEIKHVSGRKKGHLTVDISKKVDVVLVLIDYVNHALAERIKEEARGNGVKTVFARRAWSHIFQALTPETER